jgi:acyl carrier protein
MIPTRFLPISSYPLMSNGKIDRVALELASREARTEQPDGLVIYHHYLEQLIQEIWQEVLGVPGVGLDDNFFDIGGHSLLMVQVHGLLCERLGTPIPLILLIDNPTIRQISERLAYEEALSTDTVP